MQPQVSSLTWSDYRFGRQELSTWSRAVILGLSSCLLIPRGVELQLGTIMIDSSRVLLTLFGLVAVNQLLSGTIRLRATPADLLMAIHVGIIGFSAIYHDGLGEGLEAAIAVFIDMGLAYFVARVFVRNLRSYRYFVRIALIIAAITAVFGLVEMVTGYSIVRAAYHALFPKVHSVHLVEQRLSLYRALATFRVEILFGLYCMTVFALAVCVNPYHLKFGPKLYKVCLILCVLGVFASLSSGPWLGLALCIFCLAYSQITRDIRSRWKLLLFGIVLSFLFLSIVSNRGPIKLVISYLAVVPQTGYGRLVMWECIWALVPEYWPLGWGWGSDWPRHEWYIWSSIDSFYGVLLVRSGIFPVLSIVGFLAYSWYRLSNVGVRNGLGACEARGWILATVCLFLVAINVHIFGNLVFATYFLLGAGQTLFTAYESTPHPGRLFEETP